MRNKEFKKVNKNKKIAKAHNYRNNLKGFLNFIYNPNNNIYHCNKETYNKYKFLKNHHKSGLMQ